MKCFEFCEQREIICKKKSCDYWIAYNASNNCTIIASKEGPMTLQQIGEIFGVTRMRICQIEKKILNKLSLKINKSSHL
tara:strand:+ start:634 stop:870 length:237 start_codon:yes stop_codon:yes gene_type:complete